MSRRLSNIEWATFLKEVDIRRLNLPPWGGIVEWKGIEVLVFLGPTGEVFLSDITDLAPHLAGWTKEWNPYSELWIYHFPAEVWATIVNDTAIAGNLTTKAGAIVRDVTVEIAKTIGEAAGGITKPLLDQLTLPLILVGLGALLIYGPSLTKRS